MGRLDGKVAVITGAGGGMGREAAVLFSEEGAKVCAADIDGALVEEVAAELNDGLAVAGRRRGRGQRPGDVRGHGRALRRDRRPLQQRRHLAGGRRLDPRDRGDAWDRVQNVNTKGVYLCCKHGIPYLLERGGGSVINVASFVALVGAATSQISYTASKGAVLSMSRELGVQFARQGIRVNALCPGRSRRRSCCGSSATTRPPTSGAAIHLPMGRWQSRGRS